MICIHIDKIGSLMNEKCLPFKMNEDKQDKLKNMTIISICRVHLRKINRVDLFPKVRK